MFVIYFYGDADLGDQHSFPTRRSSDLAVTLSHLTPPLASVALSPELLEIEALVDEYSAADGLDARRMKLLRQEIHPPRIDRKSTRLNSSHVSISYAVFCLKKKITTSVF